MLCMKLRKKNTYYTQNTHKNNHTHTHTHTHTSNTHTHTHTHQTHTHTHTTNTAHTAMTTEGSEGESESRNPPARHGSNIPLLKIILEAVCEILPPPNEVSTHRGRGVTPYFAMLYCVWRSIYQSYGGNMSVTLLVLGAYTISVHT